MRNYRWSHEAKRVVNGQMKHIPCFCDADSDHMVGEEGNKYTEGTDVG